MVKNYNDVYPYFSTKKAAELAGKKLQKDNKPNDVYIKITKKIKGEHAGKYVLWYQINPLWRG